MLEEGESHHDRYLKTEEDTIRERYPFSPAEEILEQIPRRSWTAISAHARTMGVHRTQEAKGHQMLEGRKKKHTGNAPSNFYSDEDIALFIELYPIASRTLIASKYPYRTRKGLNALAGRLGLHRTHEAKSAEIERAKKK